MLEKQETLWLHQVCVHVDEWLRTGKLKWVISILRKLPQTIKYFSSSLFMTLHIFAVSEHEFFEHGKKNYNLEFISIYDCPGWDRKFYEGYSFIGCVLHYTIIWTVSPWFPSCYFHWIDIQYILQFLVKT